VTDTSCGVFGDLGGLDPNAINRFVVGEDAAPQTFTMEQATAQLGDPFATLVLLQGTFPRTGEAAIAALRSAAPAGDPLGDEIQPFVLGEGSQLPAGAATRRDIRFVVATGSGPKGPDVIISVFFPTRGEVELMAWDRVHGGFNYYKTVGDPGAWVYAGNSRHALSDPTQGKGPFESHASGAPIMKELEFPWNNWQSFKATIDGATVFGAGDPRRDHPWFTGVQGADQCELAVAKPAIERWGEARFDQIVTGGGVVDDPARIMLQVVGTPTVNLISSATVSTAAGAEGVTLPASFFVSAGALAGEPLGLTGAPAFTVPGDVYENSLGTFAFELQDGNGFSEPGDTHFAFFVPERAFEDDVALRNAIQIGLITPRLAAALLMVDFPNPIFSDRRASLLAHVPARAVIAGGASTFSQELADAILAAAPGTPQGSPEREFAERWAVGEDFVEPFDALLAPYFAGIAAQVTTQAGFDAYTRLADTRRRQAQASTPIVGEFALLFPQTNISAAARSMRADGTVLES
jgi:hypothetical protein